MGVSLTVSHLIVWLLCWSRRVAPMLDGAWARAMAAAVVSGRAIAGLVPREELAVLGAVAAGLSAVADADAEDAEPDLVGGYCDLARQAARAGLSRYAAALAAVSTAARDEAREHLAAGIPLLLDGARSVARARALVATGGAFPAAVELRALDAAEHALLAAQWEGARRATPLDARAALASLDAGDPRSVLISAARFELRRVDCEIRDGALYQLEALTVEAGDIERRAADLERVSLLAFDVTTAVPR